jgi:hypothetical protein
MYHPESIEKFSNHRAYISMIEPKKIFDALEDLDWLDTMHEEGVSREAKRVPQCYWHKVDIEEQAR